MVDWNKFQKKDYAISKQLATVLSYDGLPRRTVQIFTISGTAFFWYGLLPVLYFLLPETRHKWYSIFFILTTMLIPVYIIKHSIKRHRPDFKDTRFGAVMFDKYSFPSGHATRGTYMAILMTLLFPQWSWFWIIWGVLILLSRLLLGVHYVSDIIAGIFLSIISMIVFYALDWVLNPPFSSNF